MSEIKQSSEAILFYERTEERSDIPPSQPDCATEMATTFRDRQQIEKSTSVTESGMCIDCLVLSV